MKGLKQGINYLMPIIVGIDLDLVDKIVFICEQGETNIKWTYPSETASRLEGTDTINLEWTWENTYEFNPKLPITIDSKVFLKNSKFNPPTEKQTFTIETTVFTEEEIREMDSND